MQQVESKVQESKTERKTPVETKSNPKYKTIIDRNKELKKGNRGIFK